VLIIVGVIGCGLTGVFLIGKKAVKAEKAVAAAEEGGLREVFIRTVNVYAFVAALFLLGAGMGVIIDKYFTQVPPYVLYWVNMVSAILDNATLTAAEIAPSLTQTQINAAL